MLKATESLEGRRPNKLNLNMSNRIKRLQAYHPEEHNEFTVIREQQLETQWMLWQSLNRQEQAQ